MVSMISWHFCKYLGMWQVEVRMPIWHLTPTMNATEDGPFPDIWTRTGILSLFSHMGILGFDMPCAVLVQVIQIDKHSDGTELAIVVLVEQFTRSISHLHRSQIPAHPKPNHITHNFTRNSNCNVS
eukprot:3777356-Amphidinium_carterae.1